MRITLEYNGTAALRPFVKELQFLLEEEFNLTVDQTIGKTEDNFITLYDENNKVIAVFQKMPTLQELTFYIKISDIDLNE